MGISKLTTQTAEITFAACVWMVIWNDIQNPLKY